jgi:hypothetical protein
MKGTPASLIEEIMRYIFPKIHDVSWTLWDENSNVPKSRQVNVKNIIDYNLASMNFFMPFMVTADQYEGALWNLMQRAAPPTFSELFIDTRDNYEIWHGGMQGDLHEMLVPDTIEKSYGISYGTVPFKFGSDHAGVCLCLRQTPYESVHKRRLVTHEIDQKDVINDDLYITDEQHYNLFWAGTSINPLGIDLKRVAPPMLNEGDAKKYGLSPLEVSIEGMEISNSLTLEGMSKTYTGRLKTWFENNQNLWQGTLEIRGKANIRVGHLVRHWGIPGYAHYEYYVEGVMQTFNVFEGWTTTLTLTRGMDSNTVVDSSGYIWSPPAPPPPPKAPATPPSSFYTVRSGDTLWAIAKSHYGDPYKWRKIWDANSSMLIARDRRNSWDTGHWIYPGQRLIIPG